MLNTNGAGCECDLNGVDDVSNSEEENDKDEIIEENFAERNDIASVVDRSVHACCTILTNC